MGKIKVEIKKVGVLGTNCYLIWDEEKKDSYIIDVGGEARSIINSVRSFELNVRMVLCTHGHPDHVSHASKVAEAFGVPVGISQLDSKIFERDSFFKKVQGVLIPKPSRLKFLNDGDTLDLGESSISVLHTPGHTRGSLSFYIDGYLFCGDLIFKGSIGRTDLRGGSYEELLKSVMTKVFVLPSSTIIFPGHGPQTTIGEEKASNPFLSPISRGV